MIEQPMKPEEKYGTSEGIYNIYKNNFLMMMEKDEFSEPNVIEKGKEYLDLTISKVEAALKGESSEEFEHLSQEDLQMLYTKLTNLAEEYRSKMAA